MFKALSLLLALSTVLAAGPVARAADGAPCKDRDLGFGVAAAGWTHRPLSRLKRDTTYTVSREGEKSILRAEAKESASAFVARFSPPVVPPPSSDGAGRPTPSSPGPTIGTRTRRMPPFE